MFKTNISNTPLTFLIDTQADISLIKYSSIFQNLKLNQNNIINIKGITQDVIQSMGSLRGELICQNYSLNIFLHVVPNSFDIAVDGIIGKDFLKQFNCLIDYEFMILNVRLNNHINLEIPIVDETNEHTIIIPARHEFVRCISSLRKNEDFVIPSQEIAPGVIIACSIANKDFPRVRFINTNETNTTINVNDIKSNSLSDYNILQAKNNKSSDKRKSKLETILEDKIPEYVKPTMTELCKEFSDIFYLDGDKLSINNFYEQKLQLVDNYPVYVKNYRTPYSQKLEVSNQIKNLLKNDLIEPSTSNYNSPVILVPKKSLNNDKKWRLCIDYRLLNKKLIPDKYPLPRIEEILDNLGRAKYFSVIDLASGFHQVPIETSSRNVTSFSTEMGSYRWKVLPFGLNVSPNSFSRMMNMAFSGLEPQTCFLYIDDLIVIGCSINHHFKNLKSVFETCRKFNLKLNPSKCQFFKHEVTYLGHKCTNRGLLPDDTKNDTIKKYPRPMDKDAARRFVAFSNYYRRFIPHFAEIAQPLNALTKKNSDFIWTQKCEDSFIKLKNCLITPPILQYPNFSEPFIVTVDASNFACGAILSQKIGDNDLPIMYASKTFQKGELNKPTIEKELLAIHWGINYFKTYVYGTKFLVKSDHKPLIYLYSLKNPSSKLTRIRLDLSEYNFEIEHIKGKENVGADALSRISIETLKMYENAQNNIETAREKIEKILKVTTRSMVNKNNIENIDDINKNARNVEHNIVNDNLIIEASNKNILANYEEMPTLSFEISLNNNVINALGSITSDSRKSSIKNQIDNIKSSKIKIDQFKINLNISREELKVDSLQKIFEVIDLRCKNSKINKLKILQTDEIFKIFDIHIFKVTGRLILKNTSIFIVICPKIITDSEEKINILKLYHDNPIFGGHVGSKRLLAKIRLKYEWKGLSTDVLKFVKNCQKCLMNKVKNKNIEPLCITSTPQKPFERVVVDTIGPFQLSESGNKYAVTMMCDLTKFLIVSVIPTKEAKEVARAIMNDFVLIHGPMKTILTDKGTEYNNMIVEELTKLLQITHNKSTPYRHETVGVIERNHRVLNEYLRSYLNETKTNWDEYLKYFAFCYNITPNSSLNFKYTPFELIYNRNPIGLDDLNSEKISPIYDYDNYVKEAKFLLQTAHAEAKTLLENAKELNKLYYDKKCKPINLIVGDKVLLIDEKRNKLDPIFKGPYIIEEVLDQNIKIFDPNTLKYKLVHKNRIRKYIN